MNIILILTSGKVSKLDNFIGKGVDLGSFDDVNFDSDSNALRLKAVDLKQYTLIYFRMVGKSLEVATLVTDYAIKNNIKIVDGIYTKSNLMPITLGKSVELKKLLESGITTPKTVFGTFNKLPFPYVVKSTTSSRATSAFIPIYFWRVPVILPASSITEITGRLCF
ncbi:MAG: hypothetical protein UR48_C0029G0001, partial [Microgenomates group bacterium GW2011_GWD1_33_9]